MSDGLQILYRPSTEHSLGAIFLFSQIHPHFSSYGVLKISDCRVWPSAHTLLRKVIGHISSSSIEFKFDSTFPGDKFFCILKFPPIFRVMEFSKFRTVEWDHQQTHHFGQWSDTFLVILLTSNLVHSICKAFPADLFLNFDFLKVLEFWNLATLNSDPKLDKKKPNPI